MTIEPNFGRVAEWDPASDGYRVRALLPQLMERKPRSYTWTTYLYGTNQDGYGGCVGFSTGKEWAAKPQVVQGLDNNSLFEIYFDIQDSDEFPGSERSGPNSAYAGTSVHAAARYSVKRGVWRNYLWAKTAAELRTAVCYGGPVIIGVEWRTGSMDTDALGFIHPTGIVEGLHAVLVYGYSRKDGGYYKIDNHWTSDWGIGGMARIRESEIQGYLENEPELCLPVRSSLRRLMDAARP